MLDERINPIEICVGNSILYNGITCQINAIHSPAPQTNKMLSDKWVVEINIDGSTVFDTIDNMQPIPITIKILSKLGWSKSNTLKNKTIALKGFPYLYYNPKTESVKTASSNIEIKYLHHLQNFIFFSRGYQL